MGGTGFQAGFRLCFFALYLRCFWRFQSVAELEPEELLFSAEELLPSKESLGLDDDEPDEVSELADEWDDEDEFEEGNPLSTKSLMILAIATSIDALAVGVTFAFLNVNILWAITLIGGITFVISYGRRCGSF